MKNNFKDLLPLLHESKNKAIDITKEKVEYYSKHELFKDLFLKKKEITHYILSLEKIIQEEATCLKNKNKCFSDSNYHAGIKRDLKGNIYLYVYYCHKIKEVEDKFFFKRNFIYNYYRDSEISNVQLSKEYFTTSDQSLQKIVDKYKSIRDNSDFPGMYIYGDFGVGKTYLSFAFANDLAKKTNTKVSFVFLPEYINIIKKSFSNDDAKDYVHRLTTIFKEVDVLFIDDIGAEYSSEWFYVEYFLNILNQRMTEKKMTFFNSNLSLNELEKSFEIKFKEINSKQSAARLMDRIRTLVGNKEFLLKGENRRY